METFAVDREDQYPLEQFSVCVEHENWTQQQIMEYQAQALQACRAYAYAHSPFYQRFHQGLMERPLQDLPVLTKTMMMEQNDGDGVRACSMLRRLRRVWRVVVVHRAVVIHELNLAAIDVRVSEHTVVGGMQRQSV